MLVLNSKVSDKYPHINDQITAVKETTALRISDLTYKLEQINVLEFSWVRRFEHYM